MSKKNILVLSFLALVVILLGYNNLSKISGKETTSQKLQRLSRIEVYSAKDNVLINTFEDRDALLQFDKVCTDILSVSGNEEDVNTFPGNKLPLYTIITYKKSAAIYSKKELEKSLTLTLYQDSNKIKLEVAPENVKAFSVPDEYLTFYADLSDENLKYLLALAKE
jgi:hypothetical protein